VILTRFWQKIGRFDVATSKKLNLTKICKNRNEYFVISKKITKGRYKRQWVKKTRGPSVQSWYVFSRSTLKKDTVILQERKNYKNRTKIGSNSCFKSNEMRKKFETHDKKINLIFTLFFLPCRQKNSLRNCSS